MIRVIASAIVLLGLNSTALAQPALCGPTAAMRAGLAQKYNETPVGVGVSASNLVIEIWTSAKTGSFTVLATSTNGRSCMIASGENFQITDPVVEEDT